MVTGLLPQASLSDVVVPMSSPRSSVLAHQSSRKFETPPQRLSVTSPGSQDRQYDGPSPGGVTPTQLELEGSFSAQTVASSVVGGSDKEDEPVGISTENEPAETDPPADAVSEPEAKDPEPPSPREGQPKDVPAGSLQAVQNCHPVRTPTGPDDTQTAVECGGNASKGTGMVSKTRPSPALKQKPRSQPATASATPAGSGDKYSDGTYWKTLGGRC